MLMQREDLFDRVMKRKHAQIDELLSKHKRVEDEDQRSCQKK